MFRLQRWKPLTKALVLLALLTAITSFIKFDHCRNNGWVSPDIDVHACYTDISSLYHGRGLNVHQWAYSGGDNAIEYPVITGTIMWATSLLVPMDSNGTRKYFDLNIFLIALLFIATVVIVGYMKPEFAHLLPLSPAVMASLYINWDLWGIITMMAAIYYFDKKRLNLSAILIAISIATKFFPVLLLLPIAFILWRRNQLRSLVKYIGTTLFVWLAINLPVILTTPVGWWRFYKLNLERQSDWGSLWYGLSILNFPVRSLNYVTILSLLAILTACMIYFLELTETPTLADVSFIVLAGVLCVGKVYSPQYILWLVPLAVIALKNKKQLLAFWIWQAAEAIYHIAVWQHLALLGGAKFGLPAGGYALAIIARILACTYFIAVLVRTSLKNRPPQAKQAHKRLADFLFEGGGSYP
ncbi:unannotated protein [freshwater metagenome]|uniref:Unannotated protein n=1 Tax=freshwater metagenome TaxID=449393 RepID=A0A6J6UFN1_9ZZZZ|nr:mannosyltransferase [Actinomycetota bacterium]